MILYRLAIVKFFDDIHSLDLLNRRYGQVHLLVGNNLQTTQIDNIPLLASTRLDSSPICEAGYWDLPEDKREKCEHAIEYATSLVSVANGTRREIHSPPHFCVAIGAESDKELAKLRRCKGFKNPYWQNSNLSTYPRFIMDNEQLFSDRKEGILLLAEAIGHSSCTGTFRDLIRLFESAFSLPTKQVVKKLYQFLDPNLGYSKNEIMSWIRLRDPLSHADGRITKNTVVYESTVAPFIYRMRQAAYDVVMNKAVWANSSRTRRNIYIPGAFSQEPNKLSVRQGAEGVRVTSYDRFNIYRNRLSGNFSFQDKYIVPVELPSSTLSAIQVTRAAD